MANTYVDYTAVASQTDYNFSFEYLRDDHVKVKVNDVIVTNYTIVTSPVQLIRFNTAPTGGAEIRIYRDSRGDFSPLVDFVDGSVLTENELDEAYRHNLFVSQEASEGTGNELLNKKGGANYDAEGNKIINLGTPTTGTDAANKGYVDQTVDNAIALGGSPAIVSLGGYDVTSTNDTLKQLRAWTADIEDTSGSTVTATGSTTARTLANRFADVVNVLDFIPSSEHAAIKDGTSTYEAADDIQDAIDEANTGGKGVVYFPAGTYLVNTELNCTVGFPENGLTLLGADGFQSIIVCSSNIVVFRHVERFTVKRLKLLKQGATLGAAFATPNYRVTTHCLFEDLEIRGFKFGFLWRFSTHNAVRNIRMYDVACGVRLARHADTITNIGDQTNPIAAGAWNQPLLNGWYHNQNTFDTILFQGGEVGIWGSPHGNTFINITAQQQGGDGTSNVALPVGQEGTGFFLEGGGDNSALLKKGWQNSLINCYTEVCKQPVVVRDLRGLTIDGFFAQGGTLGNKYTNFIDAENSSLHLANCTGLDYFTNCLKATNCKVDSRTDLPGSGGILYLRNSTYVSDRTPTSGAIDMDSDSYFNPYGVNPGLQTNIEFSFASGTTADGQTLTLIPSLERECHYTVHVLTLRAGANPVRTGKFDVYNYGVYGGTLFNTIRADATNDSAISVAVASNNTTLEFTITDSGNEAWNGAIQVVNTRRLGSYPFVEDLNNNPPQDPGV